MNGPAGIFLAAILSPLLLTLWVGSGDPASVWSALAVMTGTQATITLTFAIFAASRLPSVTARLGIDGAYGIHAALASASVVLACAHLVAVIADSPSNVWLLDATGAPNRALAGTAALISMILLVIFAEKRGRSYEWWRRVHRITGLSVVILIGLHIWLLDRLIEVIPWMLLFTVVTVSTFLVLWWRWVRGARRDKYIVAEAWNETETVTTVSLKPCGKPMEFDAGQFAWLRLRRVPWAEDHPFTISSAPGEGVVEFTFRHAGDFTNGLLRALRPGRAVWLNGPHGAMTLGASDGSPGIVCIAAGVGLTPVISMLRLMATTNDRRPVVVLVPPGEPLFAEDLEWLKGSLDLTVLNSLARPVTAASLSTGIPDRAWPTRASYYVSGPPLLVADATTALRHMHVPADRVRTERFEIA